MCYLSFFQFFSDFPLKNRVKFDSFSLFFEFHHSLFMHFSDSEIPIVYFSLGIELMYSKSIQS